MPAPSAGGAALPWPILAAMPHPQGTTTRRPPQPRPRCTDSPERMLTMRDDPVVTDLVKRAISGTGKRGTRSSNGTPR